MSIQYSYEKTRDNLSTQKIHKRFDFYKKQSIIWNNDESSFIYSLPMDTSNLQDHDTQKSVEKIDTTTGSTKSIDNVKTTVVNEIAKVNQLNPFAVEIKKELLQHFALTCDIGEKQTSSNFTAFHLTKKGIEKHGEGQIRITVSKELKFNVQLNPYDENYGRKYFQGTWLNYDEVLAELDNFMKFIQKGEFTEHEKFTQEVNF